MDVIKFKQMLLSKNITQTELAEKLGISYQGLWKRVQSDSWTVGDVRELKKILEMTDEEVMEVFNL